MISAVLQSSARSGQAGVTLIEMMIVLVVIGIATGAATLGLGALARDDAAEQEARRLATAIGLAVDDALISGTPRTVTWDAQGYRIGTAPAHTLTSGITLTATDRTDLILSPKATTPATRFTLQGPNTLWHIAFDGLSATVAPGPAP
ncbi:MAG: prepilin-type N-terminal cleavage/methylation domain-containing protein [Paracoccaceae bacterium]